MPKVAVSTDFEDIRFQCQRCGSCCHHKRPAEFPDLVPLERMADFVERSNLIYLTEKDISDISSRTRIRAEEFIDTLYKYDGNCVKIEDFGGKVILDLPVMRSKEDTTCIFYRDGCSIYPVRPRACRLFPFRVEEKSTKDGDLLLSISYNPSCPGIGKGNMVDKGTLEKLVTDQFLSRSKEVSSRIQKLMAQGKIAKNPQIFRTHPGRREGGSSTVNLMKKEVSPVLPKGFKSGFASLGPKEVNRRAKHDGSALSCSYLRYSCSCPSRNP